MNDLHALLLKKAAEQKLAHFYIIESPQEEFQAQEELFNFTHNFIRDYYQKVEGSKMGLVNLMDHPDVFVMGLHPDYESKKDPDYIVEEAESLIRFFEMKPVQSKRKFAVIPEGHKVTSRVANKWLKLLEEPTGTSTIFLLNPRRQTLLETIHSRAQHLRLNSAKEAVSLDEFVTFLKEMKSQGLAEFLENHVRSDADVFYWTQRLIEWEAQQLQSMPAKTALNEWIKKLSELETFHQPSATKWTLFYSYLHQHVLPRTALS